jgi:hypothetical protein
MSRELCEACYLIPKDSGQEGNVDSANFCGINDCLAFRSFKFHKHRLLFCFYQKYNLRRLMRGAWRAPFENICLYLFIRKIGDTRRHGVFLIPKTSLSPCTGKHQSLSRISSKPIPSATYKNAVRPAFIYGSIKTRVRAPNGFRCNSGHGVFKLSFDLFGL